MRRLLSGLLVVVVSSLVSAVPGTAQGQDEQGQDKAEKRPPAPEAWLEPYGDAIVTKETYDDLRERLFTKADDKDVIRGLAWLVHARDPEVRRTLGKALATAYMLGDQLGDVFDDVLVPAVRALARDDDYWTRYHVLSALYGQDSPLAREHALAYVRDEIDTPPGGAWTRLGLMARRFMDARADPLTRLDPNVIDEVDAVVNGDDDGFRRRWIAAAPVRPAGPLGRFQVHNVRRGEPRSIELRPDGDDDLMAFSFCVSFLSVGVLRNEDLPALPASIDNVEVALTPGANPPEGRPTAGGFVGGAGLYGGSVSGFGADWVDMIFRYLGDDLIRVWVRSIPPEARPVVPTFPR